MAKLLWATVIFQIILAVDWTLGDEAADFGEPLFLTSFIESNNITEGRLLARVPFTDTLRIKSYAGYFTVNKIYNANIFFWYFPAMASSNQNAPILIWLQGGPGVSSLFGLLTGNGPLRIKNGRFERRKYNWALNHHMIFIDNPVGTGFSFTNSSEGYCTDENQVGNDLYSTVIQFLQLFPGLQQNKLFVIGESYGGKYVPALAHTIHKKNPTALLKINLKGIAIGNGLCDPVNQLLHSKYLYQIGLLDLNQAKIYENFENKIVKYLKDKEWEKAYDTFDYLMNGCLYKGETVFKKMTGFDFYYNYLHTKSYISFRKDLNVMLDKIYVRKGLHVGGLPFNNGTKVATYLQADFLKSITPWLIELIDNYPVLIYNGQLDIIIAFPLIENYLRKLDFKTNEEYRIAKRYIWKVDGEIAGYAKRAGNLVEVLVRNAGHLVPTDQPKWSLDLITRFTQGRWNELGRTKRNQSKKSVSVIF